MADVGDRIVGSVVLFLALLVSLGVAGVPFMLWVAEILLVVAGIMMVLGRLGTNATVGWIMVLLGPALLILPAFYPVLSVTFPIAAAVILWVGGGVKMFGLW